jgi:hydrogenase maturation factor
MQSLPIGKLRAETLQAIFDKHHTKDPRVVVGPKVGEDAAVIDMGDRYLVATSDPITFATAEIGWYGRTSTPTTSRSVAPGGAVPGDPAAASRCDQRCVSQALFADLHSACEELEVVLVGGHTEVTHGLDRPIIAGTMLGEVDKDKLVTTAGARVGDAVVMTKGVPLEGAAIIAREKEAELRERGVSPAAIRRAKGSQDPGLSILPEAEIACELATVLDARSHRGRNRHGARRAGQRRRGRASHRHRI